MRFSSILFIFSALSTLPVFARMNQLVSRTSHDHPAIARRQHHPARTSLTDICAPVDVSVLHTISALGILEASATAKVHICICIAVVPVFVKTDVRIKDYVDQVGEKNAVVTIRNMIRTADGRQSCQFPQHSTPLVSVGSDCAACDFGCDETFHKRDGKCVCDPSLFECNGRCALACGSSAPRVSLE